MAVRKRAHERIAILLPPFASAKQYRELGAFARYCILRVERDLGQRESWTVNISPFRGSYTSRIVVHERGTTFEEQGTGFDGALATWDAICKLEQRLREHRF